MQQAKMLNRFTELETCDAIEHKGDHFTLIVV